MHNSCGPMRYYYLDHEKIPQGLFTRSELNSLLQQGLITEDTLVARAGDSHFQKLSVILSETNEECSMWNKMQPVCPHCKHTLSSDSHLCSHCRKSMYCPRKGLFSTFFYVIKNSFNYKGRAGRREFWLFYLTYFLFFMLITWLQDYLSTPVTSDSEMIVNSEMYLSEISNLIKDSYTDIMLSSSFSSIYSSLLIFPFLAVSVRRLHDIGISATPVVIGSISYIIGSVFVFLFLCSMPDMSIDALRNTLTIDYKIFIYPLIIILSYICFFVTSIFLLVSMFISGHAGANQYGPAPLSK